MPNKIIGLIGEAFSGKDTVGSYLVEKYKYTRIGFADALKEHIGKGIFKLFDEQLYGDAKEILDPVYSITPREILQRAGMQIREIYPDIWVEIVMRTIKMSFGKNFVITDCRFVNEAEAIRKGGGTLWKIERPGAGVKKGIIDHPSETEQEEIVPNHAINNIGTLEELYKKVDLRMNGYD